jgi:hypothetical protein
MNTIARRNVVTALKARNLILEAPYPLTNTATRFLGRTHACTHVWVMSACHQAGKSGSRWDRKGPSGRAEVAAPLGRRGASTVEQGLGGRATRPKRADRATRPGRARVPSGRGRGSRASKPERVRVHGQRQALQLHRTGCAAEQGRVKWGPQIHVLPSFLQGKRCVFFSYVVLI